MGSSTVADRAASLPECPIFVRQICPIYGRRPQWYSLRVLHPYMAYRGVYRDEPAPGADRAIAFSREGPGVHVRHSKSSAGVAACAGFCEERPVVSGR